MIVYSVGDVINRFGGDKHSRRGFQLGDQTCHGGYVDWVPVLSEQTWPNVKVVMSKSGSPCLDAGLSSTDIVVRVNCFNPWLGNSVDCATGYGSVYVKNRHVGRVQLLGLGHFKFHGRRQNDALIAVKTDTPIFVRPINGKRSDGKVWEFNITDMGLVRTVSKPIGQYELFSKWTDICKSPETFKITGAPNDTARD